MHFLIFFTLVGITFFTYFYVLLQIIPYCLSTFPGFVMTFFSGVYGTAVGNTNQFGKEAKSYIGLCGIFIGVGEILGNVLSFLKIRAHLHLTS